MGNPSKSRHKKQKHSGSRLREKLKGGRKQRKGIIKMDTSRHIFLTHLDEKIEACKQRGAKLRAEGREDEGVFENIRMNIYEIFQTLFLVAERNSGGNKLILRQDFRQKLDRVPENWRISYEKAKEHGDARKIHIEGIKLETAQEIREIFEEVLL